MQVAQMRDEILADSGQEGFRLGSLQAEPGCAVSGLLELGEGMFSIPVTIIHGKEPGKTMLITAGVHAGEYVGIQSAIELAEELDPTKVNGTIVIAKVLCKDAFEQRAGSINTEDGKNLNREFPGSKDGTPTQQLAYGVTEELQKVADYYIDLHSGDDYEELTPYVYYAGEALPEVVEISRKMAAQVDVPYMVRSTVVSGGAYNYAASCGIPSILLERGGMGGWTMEEVQSTKRDVRNILYYLGLYEGQQDCRKYYPLDVTDIRYQSATFTGCWYPEKKVGDLITCGEVLGRVKNYEGQVLEACRAECDGVVLYQTGSLQVEKSGPMIAYGRIIRQADDRKERITNYWTKRSDSFLEQRRAELHSPLAGRWLEQIEKYLPSQKKLKILDVGCGTGFFTILLAKKGHEVTGVDLTPDMITHSRELAKEEGIDCEFRVMDAENPEFEDEVFDVVISRNLTWTLPNAGSAYEEWCRVLKRGGVLVNFDANYGASDFSDTSALPANHAHNQIEHDLMQECEDIKRQLPISSFARPAWDLDLLGKVGMESFEIDLGISRKVYQEKDDFYNPTPMFSVCARKES